MPTANADVATFNAADTIEVIAYEEPKGYGYDNNNKNKNSNQNKNKNNHNNNNNNDYGKHGYDSKPIYASFCNNARNRKQDECRRAVAQCDRKFDNNGREKDCAKKVKDKYRNGGY